MKIGTTRIETFSDGIIAIIITIMVLSFKFPNIQSEGSEYAIRKYLINLLPYFLAYAFSFLMIGIFWINHHHMFHFISKTDEPLLLLNLLFLFFMSLIPLSTAVIGANLQAEDSVALYGFIMFMTTLTFAIMRTYTIRKKLVHSDEDREVRAMIKWVSKRAKTKSFIGAASYLFAIPVAYVNVYFAYLLFLVAPFIFFIPDGIDDEKLAEKIGEKNM
jgi:uncharacterized membrane protein